MLTWVQFYLQYLFWWQCFSVCVLHHTPQGQRALSSPPHSLSQTFHRRWSALGIQQFSHSPESESSQSSFEITILLLTTGATAFVCNCFSTIHFLENASQKTLQTLFLKSLQLANCDKSHFIVQAVLQTLLLLTFSLCSQAPLSIYKNFMKQILPQTSQNLTRCSHNCLDFLNVQGSWFLPNIFNYRHGWSEDQFDFEVYSHLHPAITSHHKHLKPLWSQPLTELCQPVLHTTKHRVTLCRFRIWKGTDVQAEMASHYSFCGPSYVTWEIQKAVKLMKTG